MTVTYVVEPGSKDRVRGMEDAEWNEGGPEKRLGRPRGRNSGGARPSSRGAPDALEGEGHAKKIKKYGLNKKGCIHLCV